jgi:hypothetical protein
MEKVEKEYITSSSQQLSQTPLGFRDAKKRGIDVYTVSQVLQQIGRSKEGELLSWGVEQPYFYLTLRQRIQMAEVCAPVFGLITSRMNRVANTDFNIVPVKNNEDKIADTLKMIRDIYKERNDLEDVQSLTIKAECLNRIKYWLPDVLPNLSNFDSSMIRWKRKIQNKQSIKGEEIKEWILEPNTGLTIEMYLKKFVFDLMVHGCTATYKQFVNNKLENFDLLPGGTVYKFKSQYFSSAEGYIQVISNYEPQIFFGDEISFCEFLPTTAKNHGMIPLEALINNISEFLLFDKLMADQADGTKPPEKLVIITDNNNPFGDFDKETGNSMPMDDKAQKRFEHKLNEERKYPIMTFSGNHCEVVDLTRENTMQVQQLRADKLREMIGLVFNASNMEMNLSGSENTSGRSTAEVQSEMDMGRGVAPILKLIQTKMTKDILPFRDGLGYMFEFNMSKNESEEVDLILKKQATGILTINETREKENMSLFSGEQYNLPKDSQQQQPDGSQVNPFNMKQI